MRVCMYIHEKRINNHFTHSDTTILGFQAEIKKYQPDIFRNQADIFQIQYRIFIQLRQKNSIAVLYLIMRWVDPGDGDHADHRHRNHRADDGSSGPPGTA